jgi:Na+/proline symporter
MLGGIRAVIWTDVMQFCIMFGGLTATIIIILLNIPGGLGEIFTRMHEAGKLGSTLAIPLVSGKGLFENFATFFKTEMNLIGIIISYTIGRMAMYTGDQVMVQRFQTTKSIKDSRDAFTINALSDTLWMLGLGFVGFALFTYIIHQPIPAEYQSDMIVPYFMSRAFPIGIVGLVIAAIFAASLSSIDSAINSCTSTIMVDYYNRLYLRKKGEIQSLNEKDQKTQVRVSRIATVCLGVLTIGLACNVSRIGSLYEIMNKIIQLFTGPLFSIYLLGMFTRWARSWGVLIGGVVGTIVSIYVAFFTQISFLWPTFFGLMSSLVVGTIASLILSRTPMSIGYTYREVMKK